MTWEDKFETNIFPFLFYVTHEEVNGKVNTLLFFRDMHEYGQVFKLVRTYPGNHELEHFKDDARAYYKESLHKRWGRGY